MRLKDHYKTLQVLPADSVDEIRKSFRRLALQHHPDTNLDSPFSSARFREIREAYGVLSDPVRRRIYDEERWIVGMRAGVRNQEQVTTAWMVQQASRLRRHMKTVDTYRMNHEALRDYLLLLLADEHLEVVKKEANKDLLKRLVRETVIGIGRLKYTYTLPVFKRLLTIAENDGTSRHIINKMMKERHVQYLWERYFPVTMLAASILICIAIIKFTH